MKRMLSSIVAASGLAFGSLALAADGGTTRPDAKRGEQLYTNGDLERGIIACVSCHGAGGNSTLPINPNLAGQSHEYLVKQLLAFKSRAEGEAPQRQGPDGAPSAMTPLVVPLTQQDIHDIAYYVSMQPLNWDTAAPATNMDTMERGQQIWRGGLPDRKVPACAGCHSPDGMGIPAQYPRLAGQFPSYIIEQMKLFSSGARNTNQTMHDIADRMTERDIAAVADYAAGLR